ncbi:MAG: 2-oxo acid dehydrogenase subunit E2 [Anaerolineae bacterium]
MAIKVLMPKLSFIVTQGTILRWLKAPGEEVRKGEPLLVIESEKATVEVESPGTGILGPELAPPGTTVPVTTVIGYILEPGETPPKLDLNIEGVAPAGAVGSGLSEQRPGPSAPEGPAPLQEVKASPSARRLAQEHGVDLAQVKGTGPGGRIVERDVLAYLEEREAKAQAEAVRATPAARRLAAEVGVDLRAVEGTGPGGRVSVGDVERAVGAALGLGLPAEPVEQTPIQRVAAERMALSFRTAPHFYLSVEVLVDQAVRLREALLPRVEAETGVRLSFSDILLWAVGRALRAHPALNVAFVEGRLYRFEEVNIALAVDTPRGLTVPVLRGVDKMALAQIALRRAELVEKAREHRLGPEDLSGGTFTISNLGMFGIDVFQAILNPPQAAILAVGRVVQRPVVVGGAVQALPTVWLTLSVDHRAADGATAARFLQEVVQNLENPYRLVSA